MRKMNILVKMENIDLNKKNGSIMKTRKIIYQFTQLFILSVCLISCSKAELKSTYGACGRTEDKRFSIEDCTSPENCHVKDIGDGYCRASCGYLAVISEGGKYRGYGKDTEANTPDDPHFLTTKSSCADLEKWGVTDWKKIALIDNLEPWEVAERRKGGNTKAECCGSDRQVEKNK